MANTGKVCECGYSDYYHNNKARKESDPCGACMEFREVKIE